jgi:hypothetical protein
MEFLDLDYTIGKRGLTYADLRFNSFDLAKHWGKQNIDAKSLADFRKRIEPDEQYTLDYLVAKLGFNPTDES